MLPARDEVRSDRRATDGRRDALQAHPGRRAKPCPLRPLDAGLDGEGVEAGCVQVKTKQYRIASPPFPLSATPPVWYRGHKAERGRKLEEEEGGGDPPPLSPSPPRRPCGTEGTRRRGGENLKRRGRQSRPLLFNLTPLPRHDAT